MPVAPTNTGRAVTMTDFLLYALLAGIGVAVVAGPLGCFVVWPGMDDQSVVVICRCTRAWKR